MDLTAPCLVWLPSHSARTLRIEAGARGFLMSVRADFLARTIGSTPEGVLLRHATERVVLVPAEMLLSRADEIAHSFEALCREAVQPERGSKAVLSAHLTLICLHVWRLSQDASAEGLDLRGTGSSVLQRFRHLVDLHYRDHWSVRRYADSLGATEDRLHALCIRDAGKPPRALIHDRLIQDACARLQQMDLPIEQIAFSLGFKDPGYFNRFFKKQVGLPPGAYRRRMRGQRTGANASYAAWP